MKGLSPSRGYVDIIHPVMKTLSQSLALIALAALSTIPAGAANPPSNAADPLNVPCVIHQTVAPVFPVGLLADGVVHGKVQLLLEIDPLGHLSDSLVTGYTHRKFADEALRAVKQWRFEPGIAEGRPVISIIAFTFDFETKGTVLVAHYGATSRAPIPANDDFEYRPLGVSTLDHPPGPVNLPGPVYPKEWREQGRSGTVVIDFFIDETGQARLPTILSHTDDYLAASAIAAVKQWRFEPPTHHGQPVLARAQQTFDFQPDTKGGKSS